MHAPLLPFVSFAPFAPREVHGRACAPATSPWAFCTVQRPRPPGRRRLLLRRRLGREQAIGPHGRDPVRRRCLQESFLHQSHGGPGRAVDSLRPRMKGRGGGGVAAGGLRVGDPVPGGLSELRGPRGGRTVR